MDGIIGGMTPASDSPTYTGYRFPAAIISHAGWRYFRFSLSYRDVEELLAARGMSVTSATIRQWCQKDGQQYANQLNSAALQQPKRSYGPASSIASTNAGTSGRRTRTHRRANANERCVDSKLRVMRNAFWLPTVRFGNTFVRAVIAWVQNGIVGGSRNASRSGTR